MNIDMVAYSNLKWGWQDKPAQGLPCDYAWQEFVFQIIKSP